MQVSSYLTACTKQRTEKALSHSYDPNSGWCRFGCGNRDDGRITSRAGNVLNTGPQYSDHDLIELAERISA